MVTVNYLRQLRTSTAIVWLHYTMMTSNATNHTLTKFPFPKIISLAIGSNVMLLKNHRDEIGLMYVSGHVLRQVVSP